MPDDRRTITLSLPSERHLALARPEQVLAAFEGVPHRLDLGMLCYLVRDAKVVGRSPGTGRWVDTASFTPARRVLVQNLIKMLSDEVAGGHKRPITVRNAAQSFVNIFMGWADANGQMDATESPGNARVAITAYIGHLREQVMQQQITGISAARFQNTAAHFLSHLVGVEQEFLLRGLQVLHHDETLSVPTEGYSDDKKKQTLSLCTSIFDGLSDLVLRFEPYPYSLKLPEHLNYPNDALWVFPTPTWCRTPPSQSRRKITKRRGWVYRYDVGRLATVEEIQGCYRDPYTAQGSIRLAEALMAAANTDPRHHSRLERGAAALQAFFILFIATTGFNLQQVIDLEWGDNFSVGAERQGFRVLKWRAAGKLVTCEIQSVFLPYFRRFIALRKYLLGGRTFPYLFFGMGRHATGEPKKLHHGAAILATKALRYVDPTLPQLSPRRWRATLSDWAIRKYDPSTAAKLLQNSEKTILKRYAAGSNASQLQEMSTYFALVSRAVLDKDQEVPGSIRNATGSCTQFGNPQKDSDKAPIEPDCQKVEGCLYCDKYRVHVDETDVRKLLSCMYCLRAMTPSADSQEHYKRAFEPIFTRIEALMEVISEREPALVVRIRDEVAKGEMDPYWADKLEMLHELMLA